MNQLQDNLKYLGFSSEDHKTICACFEKNPTKFQRESSKAYDGAIEEYPICRKRPLERLVILCWNITYYRAKYAQLRIPDDIIRNTLCHIKALAQEYRKKTWKLGLSKEHVIWLRHIHNAHIFQIVSLQYQLFHMVYLDEEGIGEHYMHFREEDKKRLPPGTSVINLHIPTGADISHQAVSDSLNNAKHFFKNCFPEFAPKVILCYSWLLFPPMLEILPEKSRIAAFASRFAMIGQVRDPYGSDAVRRIYGKRFLKKADYPQKTYLQRSALHNFSKLGMGCGIIEIT